MIQITPQMRILVAVEPVDFRRGIDGLAQVCREALGADPFSGTVFVFRGRTGTSIKLLTFDGQGLLVVPEAAVQGTLPMVAGQGWFRLGAAPGPRTPGAHLWGRSGGCQGASGLAPCGKSRRARCRSKQLT